MIFQGFSAFLGASPEPAFRGLFRAAFSCYDKRGFAAGDAAECGEESEKALSDRISGSAGLLRVEAMGLEPMTSRV